MQEEPNIFDKDFHDTDPKTGRPFVLGYSDGMWLIALIYGTFALIGLGLSIASLINFNFGMLLGGGLTCAFFLTYLILLFKRSTLIIPLGAILSALFILAFAGSNLGPQNGEGQPIPLPFILLILGQIYLTWYTIGLKNDGLLGIQPKKTR